MDRFGPNTVFLGCKLRLVIECREVCCLVLGMCAACNREGSWQDIESWWWGHDFWSVGTEST